MEQSSPSADSRVLLEMQADILLITSCICELDVHRKVSLSETLCNSACVCIYVEHVHCM